MGFASASPWVTATTARWSRLSWPTGWTTITCGDCFVQPLDVPELNRSHDSDYRDVMTAELEEAVYRKYQWIFDKGFYPRERFDAPGSPSEPCD